MALAIAAPLAHGASNEEAVPERVVSALEGDNLIWPPYTAAEFSLNVYNDYTFDGESSDDEMNDAFTESSLALYTFLHEKLFIETKLSIEPVDDPDPGENRFFDNHGLLLPLLALTYNQGNWWVSAGKGGANFGISRNDAAGIYGADVTTNYTKLGGVGVSGQYRVDLEGKGSHSLYAGALRRDRSPLSKPLLGSGDRTKRSDGGIGNTSGIESWVAAIDGSGFSFLPAFRYHLAYANLAVDRLNDADGNPIPAAFLADDQRWVVAGELRNLDVTDSIHVTVLAEYMEIDDARGYRGREESYLTGSLSFSLDLWTLDLAATRWEFDDPDGAKEDNLQLQASAGYLFANGLGVDFGYRYLDELGDESHTVGLQVAYDIPVSF